MGYYGKLEEKHLAQKLRRKGYSYKEILKSITVSKDSLSRWCRDIILTEKQKDRLINKKKLGQKKGSIIAAENKRNIRIAKIERFKQQGKKDINILNKRDEFIAGIALYAAEGDKADRRGGFANSDPRIIKFMMKWFLEFAQVDIKRIRGAIWLHEGLDEKRAKLFWSNLTGIPAGQFHKTYIAQVKKTSKKIRKNIHEYGIFSIRFSDSDKQRRIIGWISALFDVK